MKNFAIFVIFFWGFSTAALAQQKILSSEPPSKPERARVQIISPETMGISEFSFWGGYSFHSNKGIWGKTSGAQLELFGLRYNRKFLSFPKNKILEYTLEFNLLASYRYPAFTQEAARTSISGVGLAPVGFQFNWRQDKKLQPFLKSAAGFLYFKNPFPDHRGVKFNFTLEAGGGIELLLTDHTSLTFGYKYHHLSNGDTGEVNPGIDSNVFYGAITIF